MYSATAENLQADTKSPISVLQELTMKEMQQLPIYTLVHDGGGTHISSFTIRVQCKGLSVEATGSSKKEAKHKAAQAMLNLLTNKLVTEKSESVIPINLMKSPDITTQEVTSIDPTLNSIGKLQEGSKTPISILQELMMKKLLQLPIYTLVHNGSGTHLSSFTIRVQCKDSSVEATASSKKEAKHKAAQAMLNLLTKELVIENPESVVPIHSMKSVDITTREVTSVHPTFNSIGKLQELCAQNRLDEPHYEIIDASGPPHDPTFTMMCTILTLQEKASARTKKQAKQDVAQKMFNRLKNGINVPESLKFKIAPVNDENIDNLKEGIEFMNLSVTNLKESRKEQTDLAKARYVNLTKRPGIVSCKNHEIPIAMYHQCFMNRHLKLVEILTYLFVRKQSDHVTFDELRMTLEKSTDILDCESREISYKLTEANLYMVGIQLSFTPQIMEIGYSTTQKEAAKNAMVAVMETLLLLLT